MKLWGGRFEKETSKLMEGFHSSIGFDARLYEEDIKGSIAHARMLGKTGIISGAEAEAIINGLVGIRNDIENGKIAFSPRAEDIHTHIEALLTERVGEAGKKLHTGRSRNDQ
ncbi:MAG: argininosuccinate lyase, partial [Clostridiales bacterium]|nr:argininosuccinate lyase [Clostridiales bacterium]